VREDRKKQRSEMFDLRALGVLNGRQARCGFLPFDTFLRGTFNYSCQSHG